MRARRENGGAQGRGDEQNAELADGFAEAFQVRRRQAEHPERARDEKPRIEERRAVDADQRAHVERYHARGDRQRRERRGESDRGRAGRDAPRRREGREQQHDDRGAVEHDDRQQRDEMRGGERHGSAPSSESTAGTPSSSSVGLAASKTGCGRSPSQTSATIIAADHAISRRSKSVARISFFAGPWNDRWISTSE